MGGVGRDVLNRCIGLIKARRLQERGVSCAVGRMAKNIGLYTGSLVCDAAEHLHKMRNLNEASLMTFKELNVKYEDLVFNCDASQGRHERLGRWPGRYIGGWFGGWQH